MPKKFDPTLNRLAYIAKHIKPSDVIALEQEQTDCVHLSGIGLVFRNDLAKIDQAFPGWREKQKPAQAAEVIRLPLWPETARGLPNSFLRSALFGVIRKGRRRYLERERLEALGKLVVLYTGARLDQGDLDVYLSLLHFARKQALGSRVQVTSYALLKLIGKSDTGNNRKVLRERIARLRATAIEIQYGQHVYVGGLLDEAHKDETTQQWVIKLNQKLGILFAPDQHTYLNWAIRQSLDGKPLAQWLHGFYASHTKPYPVKIETLHRLCGSEANKTWKFSQTLHQALDDVAKAYAAHGKSFSFRICDGLVYVEKEDQSF